MDWHEKKIFLLPFSNAPITLISYLINEEGKKGVESGKEKKDLREESCVRNWNPSWQFLVYVPISFLQLSFFQVSQEQFCCKEQKIWEVNTSFFVHREWQEVKDREKVKERSDNYYYTTPDQWTIRRNVRKNVRLEIRLQKNETEKMGTEILENTLTPSHGANHEQISECSTPVVTS